MSARLLANYLNVNAGLRSLYEPGGRILVGTDVPIFRAEGVIHRVTVKYVDDSGELVPYPFRDDQTFKFGVKDPTDLEGEDFLIYAGHDFFNDSADWDDVDPDQGKICYRFDSFTNELTAYLSGATTAGKMGRAEIEVTTPGERPFAIAQFDVALYPDVIRGSEGTPAPSSPSYPTASEVNNRLGPGIQFVRQGDKCLVLIDGIQCGSFEKPV
jgi:hypothetical protein